jgi:hypothetical protein
MIEQSSEQILHAGGLQNELGWRRLDVQLQSVVSSHLAVIDEVDLMAEAS